MGLFAFLSLFSKDIIFFHLVVARSMFWKQRVSNLWQQEEPTPKFDSFTGTETPRQESGQFFQWGLFWGADLRSALVLRES